jgi:hypothetical protein
MVIGLFFIVHALNFVFYSSYGYIVLCEFRGWVGVWYLDFIEVIDCVVVKTSLIELYIGTAIIYFSY